MSLWEKWKLRNEYAKRLDFPTQSFFNFVLHRIGTHNIVMGALLGLIMSVLISAGYYQFATHRARGGMPCNQWIAECTFHQDFRTCVAKSYELGCPMERIP